MPDSSHPSTWKYESESDDGFHTVPSPENSACDVTYVYRLNLSAGDEYEVHRPALELNGAVIEGSVTVEKAGQRHELETLDSFYLPGDEVATVEALTDATVYFGGGPYDGTGEFFVREFDPDRPTDSVHQINGEPPYEREVFKTVAETDEASRLICGYTWGAPAKWTSWPPHQHSDYLEEAYFYFDIPDASFAVHFASREPGTIEAAHPVSSGDCVAIPKGYHPTVGTPGTSSTYFWIMSAHSEECRRYDLAVDDPHFSDA